MLDNISAFFLDEDGAITVDFVVLTAAICTLGLIVATAIYTSSADLANKVENTLDNIEV